MHDLDRTQLEMGGSYESGFDGNEFDSEESYEFDSEYGYETVFDQETEMELAAELLSVTNEQELDQFLGNLLKKAGRFVGRVVKSPGFRVIGGMLKGVAKQALPIAAGALGTAIGGPLGGTIGSKLGSLGASLIKEVDMEGISPEDREFEVARRFVQMAGHAMNRLAQAPATASPAAAAQQAIIAAARRVAPHALAGGINHAGQYGSHHRRSGRWIRQGRNIVLIGA